MPISNRAFRVFVSSTFDDLTEERNALQKEVFPRLAEVCQARGASFQAIDLRWGVRAEASLAQKAIEICLAEIERCQATLLKPNFIVLLGDRYGWRPLPTFIEAEEFRVVCERITPAEDRRRVERWYQLDRNAVPPVMLLKARSEKQGTARFIEPDVWMREEAFLRDCLRVAAEKVGLPRTARNKYQASATHQEILKALGASSDNRRHAFAFFRRARGPRDPDLERLKSALTDRRSSLCLPSGNVFEFDSSDLGSLCKQVQEALEGVILPQIQRLPDRPLSVVEEEAQTAFAEERSRSFVGRTRILDSIGRYLVGEGSRTLVIHGPSGSGKSAIMARASQSALARFKNAVVLRRFIGAVPQASDGIGLLRSVCQEIERYYGRSASPSSDYDGLVERFRDCLKLAEARRPLILFLDGLDQLGRQDPAAAGDWLIDPLPENCRLVVSTTDIPRTLQYASALSIGAMPVNDARDALSMWLSESGRTLRSWQLEKLLESFECCGLPLYLRLLFEQARTWRSFDSRQDCEVGDDVDGMVGLLFQCWSDETSHGRALVGHALGCLAVARFGLAEDELCELLAGNDTVWQEVIGTAENRRHDPPERRLPTAVWSRLHEDLAPYLTLCEAPGGTVVRFFHRRFRDLAAEWYSREFGRLSLLHAQVAAMFKGGLRTIRCHSELPYHLRHSGSWLELGELLTNSGFLQGKAESGLPEDLLSDFVHFRFDSGEIAEAGDQYALCKPLGKALSNALDSISGDPSSILSQLILEMQEIGGSVPADLERRLAETRTKPAFIRVARTGRPMSGLLAQTSRDGTYLHFLKFSPDAESLLISDSSGRLTRWHWKEHRSSRSRRPSSGFFRCGSLLTARSFLAANDRQAWILDAQDVWHGSLQEGLWRRLGAVSEGVELSAVSGSAGGYALVAQLGPGLNRLLRVDAESGVVTNAWRMPGGQVAPLVNDVALSVDGKKRGICFGDGTVALSTGWSGTVHVGGAFHGEFVLADCAFLSCGADGEAVLLSLVDGTSTRIDLLGRAAADCLAWSESRRLAVVGDRQGVATLISLEARPVVLHRFRPAVEGWILSLAFSDCGRWLAVAGRSGTVRLFAVDDLLDRGRAGDPSVRTQVGYRPARVELSKSESVCYFLDLSNRLYATNPSVDSRYLPLPCNAFAMDPVRSMVMAALPGSIRRLDDRTGKYLGDSPIETKRGDSMAISPDGSQLVVIGDRRVRVYRLEPDGSVAGETACADLDIKLRPGVPIVFLDSDRVLFPLDAVPHADARRVPSRTMVVVEWTPVEVRHRLAILNLRRGELKPCKVTYSGWCQAICPVGQGIAAVAVGDPLCSYIENGRSQVAWIEAEDAGIILYSWKADEVVGRLPALPRDAGATSLATDASTNTLVASFRRGRVRIGSLAPLRWVHSIRLPGSVTASTMRPSGLWELVDDGISNDYWPMVHHFMNLADRTE